MKTTNINPPMQVGPLTPRYHSLLQTIAAILLILLFTLTGLSKIIHHQVFTIQMTKQPLPYWSKPILIYSLPLLEIGICLALSFSKTRIFGFLSASILLLAYTIYAYLAYIEVYGYVICACGKIFQGMNWRDHFFVNAALTIISVTGLYLSYRMKRQNLTKRKQLYSLYDSSDKQRTSNN